MASNETVAEIARELRSEPRAAKGEKPWVHYLADRILAAHKREIDAKNAEIAALRERLKVAEDALEKIDNMCDGDMCKYFEKTHHCSACRYLESCQTGVAHDAIHEIREKGAK